MGASTDDPLKAVRRAGWEILGILDPHYPEEMILAKLPSGKIVGVCNSNGPWGCVLDGFDSERADL